MTLTDWCKAGTAWSGTTGAGGAAYNIIGLEQYKGDTYCHANIAYAGATPSGQMSYDIYFKQDANNAATDVRVVIKDANGKVLSETHTNQ